MPRRITPLVVLIALTVPRQLGAQAPAQTPASPVATQADVQALRGELAAIRQMQEATQREVEAIRALLQQAMGPHPASAAAPGAATAPQGAGVIPVTIAGRPAKGSPKAPVTLVEFSDYHCPYCGQYFAQTYPAIDRDYVKTNRVRYVFKNYPIDQLHPAAFRAHEAAACAGDQGQYWPMHDRLFADQKGQTLDRYVEHALALNLDAAKFRNCVEASTHDAEIKADMEEGTKGGVRGTPVFVIALTDPKGESVTPTRVLVGAQPYAAFKEAIDALLAQAAAPQK